MKLVTFQDHDDDHDRLGGLLDEDVLIDLSAANRSAQFASMLALIEGGESAWGEARSLLTHPPKQHLRNLRDLRLRAPLPLPPQYRDAMTFHKHIRQAFGAARLERARASGDAAEIAAAEQARQAPVPEVHRKIPVYYKGNRYSVADPGEDIPWPAYSNVMDFELELACVIGKGGKDIPRERALDHVFGFTILNDFSARDAQREEMAGMLGPAKGKDFDKGNAFGPCLVTLDEIGDPHALRMIARVNGEVWCDDSSATMHWRFEDVIARVSMGETLHPGEIIGSGTVGDGCGAEHLRYLRAGDVVELEVEKIGVLRNRVVRA